MGVCIMKRAWVIYTISVVAFAVLVFIFRSGISNWYQNMGAGQQHRLVAGLVTCGLFGLMSGVSSQSRGSGWGLLVVFLSVSGMFMLSADALAGIFCSASYLSIFFLFYMRQSRTRVSHVSFK